MNEQNSVDLAALDRLADLYREGLITREEFEKAKTALFPSGDAPLVAPPVIEPEPTAPPPVLKPEIPAPPPPAEAPRSSSGLRRIDISDRAAPPKKKSLGPYVGVSVGLLAICCVFGFFIFRWLFNSGDAKPEENLETSPPVSTPSPFVSTEDPALVAEIDKKMEEIGKLRKTFDARLAACKFTNSLDPSWLASKAGRSRARASIDMAQKYSEEFHDAFLSTFTQAATWFSAKTGKTLINLGEFRKLLTEIRLEYRKLYDLNRKAVGYTESYRPILSRKDKVLLFNTSRQVRNYNDAISSISKQWDKIEALEQTFQKRVRRNPDM
jgi:hypothetical protein